MAYYLGQITLFALDFPPVGFASCNGQSLRIADYPALFSLIGTTYGGDGQSTFSLPNLQGRVVLGGASGAGMGRVSGTETVELDVSTMAEHAHLCVGTQSDATTRSPDNALFAADTSDTTDFYATPTNLVALSPASMSMVGNGDGHPNMQPFVALNYCIATAGVTPPRSPTDVQTVVGADGTFETISEAGPYPYLGEIRMYGSSIVPSNWASCEGQLLPIAANGALFSVLGTKFGGDGVTTFGLPDLRSHVPLHFGAGQGLSQHAFADVGGSEQANISPDQLPSHTHPVYATSNVGSQPAPSFQTMPGVPVVPSPGTPPIVPLLYAVPGANPVIPVPMQLGSVGGGAGNNNTPHENRMPLLAIRFMIAVVGITPQTQEA